MLASCTSRVCGRPSWILLHGEECSKAHTCKAALPIPNMYNMQQPSSTEATTTINSTNSCTPRERSAACGRCKHWRDSTCSHFLGCKCGRATTSSKANLDFVGLPCKEPVIRQQDSSPCSTTWRRQPFHHSISAFLTLPCHGKLHILPCILGAALPYNLLYSSH
jgi:hypothetical protein